MKKSEFHAKLVDALEWMDQYSFEKQADMVIAICDEAGMLPPPKEGLVKVEETEDGQLAVPIWGWEDE